MRHSVFFFSGVCDCRANQKAQRYVWFLLTLIWLEFWWLPLHWLMILIEWNHWIGTNRVKQLIVPFYYQNRYFVINIISIIDIIIIALVKPDSLKLSSEMKHIAANSSNDLYRQEAFNRNESSHDLVHLIVNNFCAVLIDHSQPLTSSTPHTRHQPHQYREKIKQQ